MIALGATVSLGTISEDVVNPSGTTVQALVRSVVTDPDTGARQGIAISGTAGGVSGQWQYTLDNAATWQSLGSVSESTARLLPVNGQRSRVRFVPNANANGNATITYHAWDQTSGISGSLVSLSSIGSTGGTTAYSVNTQAANQRVLAVNDAPILNSSTSVNLGTISSRTRPIPAIPVTQLLAGRVQDGMSMLSQGLSLNPSLAAPRELGGIFVPAIRSGRLLGLFQATRRCC